MCDRVALGCDVKSRAAATLVRGEFAHCRLFESSHGAVSARHLRLNVDFSAAVEHSNQRGQPSATFSVVVKTGDSARLSTFELRMSVDHHVCCSSTGTKRQH